MTTTNAPIYTVVDHTELSAEEVAFAERFGSKVIGQPGALRVAQLAYNMAKNPLRDRTRPIGIFFLAGPSRTGKSHTGATLAEILHGDADALTRIQASDYTEDHQLLELKGAPPSYVGFRDPKDPKNKLEDHETDPYSVVSPHNLRRVRLNSKETVDVVVIEEFEKSSPDFYKFWMGVFDKGVARLGNGQVADFRNTIFILTSNIGMDRFEREQRPSMGFVQNTSRQPKVDDVVMDEIKRAYKPEFRNRLDAIVVFQPFTSDTLVKIVDSEISIVRKRISEEMEAGKDFTIEVTDDAKQFMLREVNNNVAELKRVINRDVLMPLGRLLVTGKVNGGDIVRISVNAEGTALEFSVAKNALGIGENEHIIVKRGKGGGVVNLSLQRDLRKAALAAKNGGVQEFSVIARGDNRDKMMKMAVDVIHTLENVIEVEVSHVSYQRVAPFIFQVIVKGTREQMNLLCRIHEADDLCVNPTATAALPAPKQ